MSNTSLLAALEYEQEATWCVNAPTFATHRWPLIDEIIYDLKQEGMDARRIVQQLQGGTAVVKGIKSGTVKTKMHLHGHGGPTSGAVAIDPVETIWGFVFGNPSLAENLSCPTRSAPNGTTINGAGSTTTVLVTTASGTFARGALCRVGTGGISADGKGSGQFYPIANHTGTNLTLRHATITAPSDTNVVHSGVNFYLPETTPNSTVKSWRGRILTPDQQYITRGMFPTAIVLAGLSPAETSSLEVDWGVSDWDETNGGTWPSAVASNQYNPSPNAGGSFVVTDVGSSVRTAYDIRQFSVTIDLGIIPFEGHAGVGPYQKYISARRVPSKVRGSFTVDAPAAAAANVWLSKFDAGTAIAITNSLSVTSGSAQGIHMQNCKILERPKQVNVNGINGLVVNFEAHAGTDLTTELSQAAFVYCAA